jgi:hypothetical protein
MIWEIQPSKHCSMPLILSAKTPRPARVRTQTGTSNGNRIEIATWTVKCLETLNQDGPDSFVSPLNPYSRSGLLHLSLDSVIIHGASGVKGATDLHGKALVLIFTLVIRVDGQDRDLNYVQITTHCMYLWGMTDPLNELPLNGNRNDTYISELFTSNVCGEVYLE